MRETIRTQGPVHRRPRRLALGMVHGRPSHRRQRQGHRRRAAGPRRAADRDQCLVPGRRRHGHHQQPGQAAEALAGRAAAGPPVLRPPGSPYERNTMFYEFVQRRGARGFGGANIRAPIPYDLCVRLRRLFTCTFLIAATVFAARPVTWPMTWSDMCWCDLMIRSAAVRRLASDTGRPWATFLHGAQEYIYAGLVMCWQDSAALAYLVCYLQSLIVRCASLATYSDISRRTTTRLIATGRRESSLLL